MKIGLLGGTFDPVHIGHMVLAQECRMRLCLDKVIFVPAYVSPHKTYQQSASSEDRLRMLELALEGDERFSISTYEIDKQGTSYSIETIEHFRKELGEEAEIFFLTGSDSAEALSTWKDIDRILEISTFVIASRPGWGLNSPYADKVTLVEIPLIEVSSSMIRDRIKDSQPIEYLVAPAVSKYIRDKALYK